MTILLTGAQGFVGRHLKKRLESEGHIVFAPSRLGLAVTISPVNHAEIYFDAIINCAAELTDESKMYESNYLLIHRLLNFARDHKVGKFIQIGSSSEYGKTNKTRREDMDCVPTNKYETTKLDATWLCQDYALINGMDIVIARPFSLYGDGDKPRKLIPTLYRSYLEHTPINLHPGSHDFLWIDEFVDGLILLLNAPKHVTQGQIFNFGSGISSTNEQVVSGLEAALGAKLDIRRQSGRYHAHDVDNWVADISKARNVLGWTPKISLNAGLKEYVMREWFAADRSGQGT